MCADVVTPVYQFTEPDVGASDNTWGEKLNANWAKMEALLADGFAGGTPTDLGTLKPSNAPAATDTSNFNTISTNGVYSNSASNAVGAPTTSSGFIVLHNEMLNDNAVQTASRPAGFATLEFGYIRTRYNLVWTAWDQMATLTTYTVTNFDTLKATGEYTATAAGVPGAPVSAGGNWLIQHVQLGTNNAIQYGSNPTLASGNEFGYVRMQRAGVWGAWDVYISSSAYPVSNLNTLDVTSVYTNSTTTAVGLPFSGSLGWIIKHVENGAGGAQQDACLPSAAGSAGAYGYMRFRSTAGGAWTAWTLMAHPDYPNTWTAQQTFTVPIVGAAVTQSKTDTTAGRLLKTGDYGMGLVPVTVTNFNTISVTGNYTATAAGVVGAPSPSGGNWLIQHVQLSVNNAIQYGSNPTLAAGNEFGYVRMQRAGSWGAWDIYISSNAYPASNFDTIGITSVYTNATTIAVGLPFSGSLGWIIKHVENGVGGAQQDACLPAEAGSAGAYGYMRFRATVGGAWTPWTLMAHPDYPNTWTAQQTFNAPIVGTAVTQNNKDITAGRLLRTGDYGLSNAPIVITDFNAPGCTGVYTNTAAALWSPDGSTSTNWIMLHLQRVNGATADAFQMAMRPASPDNYIWTRTRSAGAWTPWSFNYGNDGIIGPVSMLAGVPNGAVIETGSSANGSYTKFADGTLICTHPSINFSNCQAANGALFQSATTTTWTFPLPFLDGTFASISGNCDDTDMWPTIGTYNHVSALIRAKSSVTKTTAKGFAMMAIGRWF